MKYLKSLIALRATRLLIVALAVNLASVKLMHAQEPHLSPPLGAIGWSESADLCKVLPGSAASKVNYAQGTLSFTAASFGTIRLACPMSGIMNGIDVGSINDFAFSFSDVGGQTGVCTVAATFVDHTTGIVTNWSSGGSFNPRYTFHGPIPWTVDIGLNNFPLNAADLYEVDITLTRPKTAVGVCFPTAFGVYMEAVTI